MGYMLVTKMGTNCKLHKNSQWMKTCAEYIHQCGMR